MIDHYPTEHNQEIHEFALKALHSAQSKELYVRISDLFMSYASHSAECYHNVKEIIQALLKDILTQDSLTIMCFAELISTNIKEGWPEFITPQLIEDLLNIKASSFTIHNIICLVANLALANRLYTLSPHFITILEIMIEDAADVATNIIATLCKASHTAAQILFLPKVADCIMVAMQLKPKAIYHNVLEAVAQLLYRTDISDVVEKILNSIGLEKLANHVNTEYKSVFPDNCGAVLNIINGLLNWKWGIDLIKKCMMGTLTMRLVKPKEICELKYNIVCRAIDSKAFGSEQLKALLEYKADGVFGGIKAKAPSVETMDA
jgi:hypothetical protein